MKHNNKLCNSWRENIGIYLYTYLCLLKPRFILQIKFVFKLSQQRMKQMIWSVILHFECLVKQADVIF